MRCLYTDNNKPPLDIMKKSPTLPSIRDKEHLSQSAHKQKHTFRLIETRVNSHDEEIVRNEKIISSLANQFKLLKEQLEFEQDYSQKYKDTLKNYEEENSRYIKTAKEQKITINRLEGVLREKDIAAELAQRELRQKVRDQEAKLEETSKALKRKQVQLRAEESQKESLLKSLKEKESLKMEEHGSQSAREQQALKMQKEIELLNVYLGNSKRELADREKQIEQVKAKLSQQQGRMKESQRREQQLGTILQQNKLLRHTCDQCVKREQQLAERLLQAEKSLKAINDKSVKSLSRRVEQLQRQKQENGQKLQGAFATVEQLARKIQSSVREVTQHKQSESILKQKLGKLENKFEELSKSKLSIKGHLEKVQKSTVCEFCRKELNNPVTSIPCGHSFCLNCKKGYEKECFRCPGLKREAVYRNELLDDIVEASRIVQLVIDLLNFKQ